MPGMVCPKCGAKTLFEKPYGGLCSKCGCKMVVPANDGKGGKGQKCSNCGRFTVFEGKCRKCGAKYEWGEKHE